MVPKSSVHVCAGERGKKEEQSQKEQTSGLQESDSVCHDRHMCRARRALLHLFCLFFFLLLRGICYELEYGEENNAL